MNKLPLTNIEKFKKVRFTFGIFETPFEHKEFLYYQKGDDDETTHGNCKHNYQFNEGILIRWESNPFNLNHDEDNYLILTDKRKNF